MRKKYQSRFPVARIKKIMQKDEEVGKIAQATPVVVSKALELFLQELLGKCVDITKQSGGRTLSAAHLKQCVSSCEKFDFLKEVVENVQEPEPESSKRGRPRGSSSNGTGSTSRGRGRGRGGGPSHEDHSSLSSATAASPSGSGISDSSHRMRVSHLLSGDSSISSSSSSSRPPPLPPPPALLPPSMSSQSLATSFLGSVASNQSIVSMNNQSLDEYDEEEEEEDEEGDED